MQTFEDIESKGLRRDAKSLAWDYLSELDHKPTPLELELIEHRAVLDTLEGAEQEGR